MEEKNGIDKLCCEPSGGCSGCLLPIFIIFIMKASVGYPKVILQTAGY